MEHEALDTVVLVHDVTLRSSRHATAGFASLRKAAELTR
jgi:hypothetical protein